jgi:long-chain acyl-CoA synthetase
VISVNPPQGNNAFGYLGTHAARAPDRPAIINVRTGQTFTYGKVEAHSNRLARHLRWAGLRRGDHFAVVLENNIRYAEIAWAALRSGLVMTPISKLLTPDETAYIIADCGARVVITSHAMRELAEGLTTRMRGCPARLMVDGTIEGWDSYEDALASQPTTRLVDESLGSLMLYSSGTTGRPKGIFKPPLTDDVTDQLAPNRRGQCVRYGYGPDMVYLSTAPFYHAAPLFHTVQVHCCGGTALFMEKFDEVEALSLIERYRVTHSQWVPTMFVRMLKLEPAVRESFDLSSHRVAIHAAAPCPLEIKRRMIEWWGPILYESYGATEGNGGTSINSQDWLGHPGSVGRATVGKIHICDDDGVELPTGQCGLIYFEREGAPAFAYHNDSEKTRAAQHPQHETWTAVGDVGYVDDEGYLYLTDRKSFMIISGGVNIYPQAIEDALVTHDKVDDVAVIGVPHAEMGEEVKAVVKVARGVSPSSALAEELIAFLRGKIGRHMMPRSVDFCDELPRLPTGKLHKQALRDRYYNSQENKHG